MGATLKFRSKIMKYWILDRLNNLYEICNSLSDARTLFDNYYGEERGYKIEKARNFYEVGLMRQVEGGVAGDLETFDYVSGDFNYRECVKIAKELSKEYDACCVVCYTKTYETDYEELSYEKYVNGKKCK